MRTAIACLFLCPAAALAQPASFQGIGHVPGLAPRSAAYGTSADGSVVVGNAGDGVGSVAPPGFPSTMAAVRWTQAAGIEVLPAGSWAAPNLFRWVPFVVSDDGTAIAGRAEPRWGSTHGWAIESFHWTAKTGLVHLGVLPGNDSAAVFGMSGDGSKVVGTCFSFFPSTVPDRAYTWTSATGMSELFSPTPGLSWGTGISRDGSTVIGVTSPEGGFRLHASTGLEVIPGFPVLVSADGLVVAYEAQAAIFLWRAGVGTSAGPLGLPGAGETFATALSADGSVLLGQSWYDVSDRRMFLWDQSNGLRSIEHVLRNEAGLELSGWQLLTTPSYIHNGLSADGRVIVGSGRNPCGQHEGWIARLGTSCYADCDGDGFRTIADFACFLQKFAAGDAYANCDHSCTPPVHNIADFSCYLQRFAACP